MMQARCRLLAGLFIVLGAQGHGLAQAQAPGGRAGALTEERSQLAPSLCRDHCLGTARILRVGTKGGGAVGLKTYPQTLPLGEREVVLTFDDGPWPDTTARVLDVLKAHHVKATFFLIGRNAQAHPALAQRMRAEGHTIAHHSWSHPGVTLRGLSPAQAQAEIDKGIDADERAAGWQGGGPATPRVPFFRFPGFADTPELLQQLARRDIVVFGADLWASDWMLMTPEAQLRLTMRRLQEAGRGIVLFHDTRRQTADMIEAFLRQLQQQGFKVVHLVPEPAHPLETIPAPAGWTSETQASLARIMPRLIGKGGGSPSAGPRPKPAEPAQP